MKIKINKYSSCFICSCGRIHLLESSYNDIFSSGKEIMFICKRCGKIFFKGAEDCGDHFEMYSYDLNSKLFSDNSRYEITKEDFNNKLKKIVISYGINPILENGHIAEFYNSYSNEFYYDNKPMKINIQSTLKNIENDKEAYNYLKEFFKINFK